MTAGPAAERPTPRWVKVTALVAGLAAVALVGVVYLAGGFSQRSDWLVRSPGEEIDAGNLAFTLASATAQRDDSTGAGTWTVTRVPPQPARQMALAINALLTINLLLLCTCTFRWN